MCVLRTSSFEILSSFEFRHSSFQPSHLVSQSVVVEAAAESVAEIVNEFLLEHLARERVAGDRAVWRILIAKVSREDLQSLLRTSDLLDLKDLHLSGGACRGRDWGCPRRAD